MCNLLEAAAKINNFSVTSFIYLYTKLPSLISGLSTDNKDLT